MTGFRRALTEEQSVQQSENFKRWAERNDPADAIPPDGNYYDTGRWAWLRNKTIMRYGAACQKCGTRGSSHNPIQVDHIKPRSRYREMENDPKNLQVLCKNCNHEKSNTDETDWRSF